MSKHKGSPSRTEGLKTVNLGSLCIDPVENCCSVEFVNETSSVHNPNHEPPGTVSRDSYIVTSPGLNVSVKNQSYVSIFQAKQLSNSRSEILSESCSTVQSTMLNRAEREAKENLDLVHDAVKSETDSVLAPITVSREINVLDPMVNQCNPSLQTVFPKTSNETEPSDHLHEVEFENCDHELILVERDAIRYSGYRTLDLEIHPRFDNNGVTASTSARNNPVQDLKSVGDLVHCEFMVKSVSCASKYAHLEMAIFWAISWTSLPSARSAA